MDREYGGVIWTNHALNRLRQRKIKQGDAWATWRRPDSSKFEKGKGVWVYERTFKHEKIQIVAKKNDKGRWLILSVWSTHLLLKDLPKNSFLNKLIRRISKL